MAERSITALFAAQYVRRRSLILHLLLPASEDGLNDYCTPYWKLWKTEETNIKFRSEPSVSPYLIYSLPYWKPSKYEFSLCSTVIQQMGGYMQ